MRWAIRLIVGFFCGVGVDYAVAIIVSYAQKLGYFMPCFSTLPEIAGGEMRAVIFQALAFGLPGAGFSAIAHIRRLPTWSGARRMYAYIAIAAISLAPFVILLVMTLSNMPY